MAGPIAVELVANPPPTDDATQALLAGCSAAAGPAGCILVGDASLAEPPPVASPSVVVRLYDGWTHVRVEARGGAEGAPASGAIREASFRDTDPPLERFRAAGLMAAGVWVDATTADRTAAAPSHPTGHAARSAPEPPAPPESPPVASPAPERPPPPAPDPGPPTVAEPGPESGPVVLSAAVRASVAADSPRLGGELAADFVFNGLPVFVTTGASYEQSLAATGTGISQIRGTVGAGAGIAWHLPSTRLSLRARTRLQLEAMRLSVDQPQTHRRDAASVLLPGVSADLELVWALTPRVGAFGGLRVAWADDEVVIAVANKPAGAVGAWSALGALGVVYRLP